MKKAILITFSVIAVLVVLFAGYTVWSINDYISKTPEISPKEGVVCEAGEEIKLEEMFEVVDKDGQTIGICGVAYSDGGEAAVSISEDKQSVVFDKSGSYMVYCIGEGSNHELRSAETIVTVKEAAV